MSPRRQRAAMVAMDIAHRGGFSLQAACEFYQKHHGVQSHVRISEAAHEMLEQMEKQGRRPKTISSMKSTLDSFAAWGDQQLCDVSKNDVLDYVLEGDHAVTTRLHQHARLRRFFNWAVRRNYLTINPAESIHRGEDIGEVDARDIHALTADEVERIMFTALKHDRGMIPFLTLAIFCGIRPGELLGGGGKSPLSWDHVCFDEDRSVVKVTAQSSKTNERRHVTISPNAEAWLRLGGELPFNKNHRKRRDKNALLAKVELSPDVFRHTFASMHLRLHNNAVQLKEEMGHSESSQTLRNHYLDGEVTLADARKFWELTPGQSHPQLIQSVA